MFSTKGNFKFLMLQIFKKIQLKFCGLGFKEEYECNKLKLTDMQLMRRIRAFKINFLKMKKW